jgi:hypothetical protein
MPHEIPLNLNYKETIKILEMTLWRLYPFIWSPERPNESRWKSHSTRCMKCHTSLDTSEPKPVSDREKPRSFPCHCAYLSLSHRYRKLISLSGPPLDPPSSRWLGFPFCLMRFELRFGPIKNRLNLLRNSTWKSKGKGGQSCCKGGACPLVPFALVCRPPYCLTRCTGKP